MRREAQTADYRRHAFAERRKRDVSAAGHCDWPTICLLSVRNPFSKEGEPMAFTFICHTSAVEEGGMGLFHVGRKSVLLVWPRGDELKAYRGRCPDADVPFGDAKFNGTIITCPHHHWVSTAPEASV